MTEELHKIVFSAEEEYPILLALDAYVRDYEPATAGEANHLDHAQAILGRLADRYNARRRIHGHSELTFGRRPQKKQPSDFEMALKEMFLGEVLDEANTLADLRKLVDQIVALHEGEKRLSHDGE